MAFSLCPHHRVGVSHLQLPVKSSRVGAEETEESRSGATHTNTQSLVLQASFPEETEHKEGHII